MRVMRRGARRTVQGAKLKGRHVFKSGVLIRGTALTCGLLLVWIVNGWSNEPPKEGGHHDHQLMMHDQIQMMMQHVGSTRQRPQLEMPKGWQFAIPAGDHHAGRQVFIDFECFKCHEVLGEDFPAPKAERGDVGPALSGMGSMHPGEYFAETIIDPNASVAWRVTHHKTEEKGYLGADGTSKMPSYNETMTVQQLIDLVAYMKSLTAGAHQH